MERSQVVNGCNGSCCSNFYIPVSPADIQLMVDAYDGKVPVTEDLKLPMENGSRRFLPPEKEIRKLHSMLIHLGLVERVPGEYEDDERSATERWKDKGHFENGEWSQEVKEKFYITENNTLMFNTYTCKHYDTVNKICMDYEDRPNMCRIYGKGCNYKGCGFDEALAKLEQVIPDNNASE